MKGIQFSTILKVYSELKYYLQKIKFTVFGGDRSQFDDRQYIKTDTYSDLMKGNKDGDLNPHDGILSIY